jgi:ABC-2 type transport system permease protein
MTVLPLLGLAALVALLWLAWSRSLGPARWARPTVRGSAATHAAPRGWASSSATGAVLVKELRTWTRDPQRLQGLIVPPVFAVLSALVPLAFDSTAFLPFLGALTALMGAATSANLYGQDGTALWLTLLMPGSERADVRGRQLAWLVLFIPMTLVLSGVGIVAADRPDLVPWALTATFAVLGGGAGLVPLVGLDQLVPGPDPRASKNALLDHSDVAGQAFVMLFLALGTAAPALAVVLTGELLDNPSLIWAGLPVSVVTGFVAYLMLGRAAHQSLVKRGPELLYLMRTGKEQRTKAGHGTSFLTAMPKHRRRLLWSSFFVGCIALFPQALVPLLMKLSGDVAQLWFLALYMPQAWQWPVIILMFAIGAASLALAARICVTELKAVRA